MPFVQCYISLLIALASQSLSAFKTYLTKCIHMLYELVSLKAGVNQLIYQLSTRLFLLLSNLMYFLSLDSYSRTVPDGHACWSIIIIIISIKKGLSLVFDVAGGSNFLPEHSYWILKKICVVLVHWLHSEADLG